MALWKKRRFDDCGIDYESMEEMLAEALDGLGAKEIDFTRPVKMGFTVMLDNDGFLRLNEFGLLSEEKAEKKTEEPLVDVIDMDNELMIVIETNNLPAQDIDVKVMEQSMVISSEKQKKFIKKIAFPCKVKHASVRTSYNNNILEVRLPKREYKQSVAK